MAAIIDLKTFPGQAVSSGLEMTDEYSAFLEKFETKKTTDDCYTPVDVYACILEYVRNNCDIEECRIVRPFYPNGDYENMRYENSDVVIDNPPFSIISKIIRFYNERGIKYFLFAPHLTLFNYGELATTIVCGASITYNNGAKVKTSFITNLFGEGSVIGEPDLYNKLQNISKKDTANLTKYNYPKNLITISMIQSLVERGVSINIGKNERYHIRALENQKKIKKSIFGAGFLVSDKIAKMKEIEMRRSTIKRERDNEAFRIELTDREVEIIESLNNN